jgi:hypothetical protein
MRDDTQLTEEERYQIEALLKMGHHQSEIVRYGNVLVSRLRISYSPESIHRLHLRVESAQSPGTSCSASQARPSRIAGGT